jgi:hypothetical protein
VSWQGFYSRFHDCIMILQVRTLRELDVMSYSKLPLRCPKLVAELLGQFPRSLLVVGTNKVAIALFGGSN